jgi:hypothetical protein
MCHTSLPTAVASANSLMPLVRSPRHIKYANVICFLDVVSRGEESHVGDKNKGVMSIFVLILILLISFLIERPDQRASVLIRDLWVKGDCRYIFAFAEEPLR